MSRISVIPPHIVAKIAAGEVIENPASIVKELVDNAIDAGASDIRISLIDAGKESISITDNGHGMSREDILLSYHPHTTSKLGDEELVHIHNLGFRGEALASIVSVATVTIRSREQDTDMGTEVVVNAIDKPKVRSLGMSVGTQIIVEDLFTKVPARKAFLKDTATELRSVIALVSTYALAYPHIAFSLIHEEKHIFALRNESRSERIKNILGHELDTQLLPLTIETEFGTLEGFIGTPQSATTLAHTEHLFINNRVIDARVIRPSVINAYGTLLEKLTYPPFIFWLTVPHTHIDVNVHPRKDTVRFLYEQEIFDLITQSIAQELQKHDLVYKDRNPKNGEVDTLQTREMDIHLAKLLKQALKTTSEKNIPIIQVHNTYLITETADGVLLVDQHAAHERILYEKFLATFKGLQAQKTSVSLAQPTILELSAELSHTLEHNLEVLASLGFDIEIFGTQTFKIGAVPEIYATRDLRKLIPEVLHDIVHFKEATVIDHETKRTLSFLACRSAIKAGDILTEAQSRKLLEDLTTATTPYTCPHGRPTHIELSRKEIDRMFKRIV